MLLISHRGNVSGSEPDLENNPAHIDRIIVGMELNVEIDLWVFDQQEIYLGHDEPQYGIDFKWLYTRRNKLWIHCKNIEALVYMHNLPISDHMNYFWHEMDDYTMTSKGYIWAYPGKEVHLPSRAIAVMPEINKTNLRPFYGICTDWPERYLVHDKVSSI
jgi:hypothetical protein